VLKPAQTGVGPDEPGDLAEIERLGGRGDRAENALERALALYEQKGLVPMAERTRAQLAELRVVN
jgi:dethiobiotin synthetase